MRHAILARFPQERTGGHMLDKFVLGVGPGEKLQTACRRHGEGQELIDWLCAKENLKKVRQMMDGTREPRSELKRLFDFKPVFTVDCSLPSNIPSGFSGFDKRLRRRKSDLDYLYNGVVEVASSSDVSKFINEHRIDNGRNENVADGLAFLNNAGGLKGKGLDGEPVFIPSRLFEFLWDYSEYLPDEVRTGEIYLFTVYRSVDGTLCVRCHCWNSGADSRVTEYYPGFYEKLGFKFSKTNNT